MRPVSRVVATPVITADIYVRMDAETADWLRGYLQNSPFHGPEHELPAHTQYRSSVWHALDGALKAIPPVTPR